MTNKSQRAYPHEWLGRSTCVMCIRCHLREAPQALDYCASCGREVRLEVARGLRELDDYLRRWSSLDDWLSDEQAA